MRLTTGAPAPDFSAPSPVNANFAFGSVGGRYVLLAFLPGPGPEREAALDLVRAAPDVFRDDRAVFFGVLPDAASFAEAHNTTPLRWFGDLDGRLARLYGAVDEAGALQPVWVLIDPTLRIMAWSALADGARLVAELRRLGAPEDHAGVPSFAPVLVVPRIFEPRFCDRLIDFYRGHGGAPSGTMIERDGKTVGIHSSFKRRRDAVIEDEQLIGMARERLRHRLLPEIAKAFQFTATHIERYIVACYDAEDGGWFNPHRDNTTLGTAHRKFAVSINLNADFEGGDLRFPEYGQRTFRPPPGGAVVFSCALLHEATRITRGTRYAFLPFLYDQAGADIRAANLHALEETPEEAAAES